MDHMERLRNPMGRLRGTPWLVPAAISLVAFVLAYALPRLSPLLKSADAGEDWWLFSGAAARCA